MEKQLGAYLYKHIPLSGAMGVQVRTASLHKVILSALFDNNINHKRTIFGGSLHAVATLACWSLLYLNLKETSNEQIEIVITKSDVNYLAPVDTDFKAECCFPEPMAWQRFIKILQLKGKARIQLHATIHQDGQLCVDYQGIFAAIKKSNAEQNICEC